MNLDKYDFKTFENYLYNLALDYVKSKLHQSGYIYDAFVSDQTAENFSKKLLTFYVKEDFELEFDNRKNKFLTKIKNINNLTIKDYIFRDYNSVDIKFEKSSYFDDKINLYNEKRNNIYISNKNLITRINSDCIYFSGPHNFLSLSHIDVSVFDYIINSNRKEVFEKEVIRSDNSVESKSKFNSFLTQVKNSFFDSFTLKITNEDSGIKFSNIINNLNFLSEMNSLNLEFKRIIFDKNGILLRNSIFDEPFIKETIIGRKISENSLKNDVINSIDMISLTQDIDYSSFKELLINKTKVENTTLKNI